MISSQAWALRRMISTYNAITRRPHVPRERGIRQIMHEQGLDVEVDPPVPELTLAIADGDPCDDDGNPDDAANGPFSFEEGEESELDDDVLVDSLLSELEIFPDCKQMMYKFVSWVSSRMNITY